MTKLEDLVATEKKLLFDIIKDHWHVAAQTYTWASLSVFEVKNRCAIDSTNEEQCEKFIELAHALTLHNLAYVFRIHSMNVVASNIDIVADMAEHRVRMQGYYPEAVNAKDPIIETLTKENERLRALLRDIMSVIDSK